MNKRDFVVAGCGTLAAAAVLAAPEKNDLKPASTSAFGRLQRLPDLQASVSLSTWKRYVGERFVRKAPGGDDTVVLRRVEVIEAQNKTEQFSLLFASQNEMEIADATTGVRHSNTGQQIVIFMQPAGLDGDGATLYRADFNRLT